MNPAGILFVDGSLMTGVAALILIVPGMGRRLLHMQIGKKKAGPARGD